MSSLLLSFPLNTRGAVGSNLDTPLQPAPPQFFEHVFLQIEFFGKSAGAEGTEFFFRASSVGNHLEERLFTSPLLGGSFA